MLIEMGGHFCLHGFPYHLHLKSDVTDDSYHSLEKVTCSWSPIPLINYITVKTH